MSYRVITVPKNTEVEKKLDFNEAKECELIELKLTKNEFYYLYKEKIFDIINDIADVNIDDFEHDFVKGDEKLLKVLEVLELKKNIMNPEIIGEMIRLFKEAINRNTGVYFYF